MPLLLISIGIFLLAIGCGRIEPSIEDTEIRPGQLEAMRLVWNTVYGMPEDVPPPPIKWSNGVDCGGPSFGIPVQTNSGFVCGAGSYDGNVVILLRSSNMAETAIAHEYMHAMLHYLIGNADEKHERPEWKWVIVANNSIHFHNANP